MGKPLRVLMVEDSEDDVLLTVRALKKGGYDPVFARVEDAGAMLKALQKKTWDVILCDYQMPQFNGLAAIALLKETGIDIPLIIVSGAIGEETAVKCMRSGASDYVMKDHLSRLVPAIERELQEAESRSKRRQAEEALKENEERFRQVSSMISDVAYSCSMKEDGIFSIDWMTGGAERISGYSIEEIKAQKCWRFLVIDEDLTLFDKNVTGLPPGSHASCELRIQHKSGGIAWVESYAECTMGMETPQCFLLYGALVDITERKQAEQALQQSEKKYRELYDFLPIPVYEMDFEANLTSVNRAVYETFGGTEEDFKKGVNAWKLLSPEEVDRSAKNILRLLKGEKIGGTEYNLKRLDGSVFHAIVNSSVTYSDGKPVGLRGSIVDITNRKLAEEALKESENKYRLLADNANDVIFVLDMNLNYTYVSPSVKILRGYEPEEVLKSPSIETLTPSSWDLAVRTLSEVNELEKSEHRDISISRTLQLEMWRKDGTTVWTEVKFSFIRDENQRPVGILGVTRDITDRRKTSEELQQTFDRLRKSINATIQVMVSAVEVRDPYTSGHQIRSANLARVIATEMGLPPKIIDGLRMAGSIHDIGKLSVPAEILSKPTKLTNIEFSLIKEHSRQGYEILKDVESPWPLAEIVYQHHERMDGSGYPRNLKGEEIMMEARILAVADVVESMASHRPYRPAFGLNVALAEIENNKGTLYDADVVDACLRLFREKGFQF